MKGKVISRRLVCCIRKQSLLNAANKNAPIVVGVFLWLTNMAMGLINTHRWRNRKEQPILANKRNLRKAGDWLRRTPSIRRMKFS
jgi:hypothetical protein